MPKEYDDRGRLQAAYKDNQPYATYAYDANGNRTTQTAGGDQTTATFDNRDRMRAQGDYEFSYNKNGEMTARENTATNQTATFSYDTFGNLTGAATEDGDQITYKLDSDANRATREVNGQLQSRYIYARGIQGPIAELAGDNTVKARYVYGTRSIVPDYMVKNGNTYRLLTDQLGSVRLVVDASSGAVAQEIEYDPFGAVIRDTNEGFQPFGFAGGLYDSATGLTHFGAREYDARMGRWTASDPISFSGGDTNLYGYVLADPVNFLDPAGTDLINAISQAFMGFGDALTLGGSSWLRDHLGLGHVVDECAWTYQAGGWAAVLVPIPGLGKAKLAELPGLTGFTKHGLNTVIGYPGRAGTSNRALRDAVRNPRKVISQSGGRRRFEGEDATVVLNSDGKVVTAWPTGSGGVR